MLSWPASPATLPHADAELIVFPELSVTGYPPRDLVEKPSFLVRSEQAVQQLAAETAHLPLTVLAGYVGRSHQTTGKCATNSAAVLRGGKIIFRQTKVLLPTYDVFDEDRYFVPADHQDLLPSGNDRLAIAICEDAWNDKQFWPRPLYSRDPVEELISAGGSILIIPNALALQHSQASVSSGNVGCRGAPPRRTRHRRQSGRRQRPAGLRRQQLRHECRGEVIASAASFSEDLVLVDTVTGKGDLHANLADENEAVYEALVLGTRDYIRKCGFSRVLIGLSGGIDSSLTAAIAVEAVGRENVIGVGMPGPFSSDHSVADARDMAQKLGIRFELISITPAYRRNRRHARPGLCGSQSRRHGREYPVAASRTHPDGALQ